MLGMRDAGSVADGQQQIPPRTMGCWACAMLGQRQMVSGRSRSGQCDVGMRDAGSVADGQRQVPLRTSDIVACTTADILQLFGLINCFFVEMPAHSLAGRLSSHDSESSASESVHARPAAAAG